MNASLRMALHMGASNVSQVAEDRYLGYLSEQGHWALFGNGDLLSRLTPPKEESPATPVVSGETLAQAVIGYIVGPRFAGETREDVLRRILLG